VPRGLIGGSRESRGGSDAEGKVRPRMSREEDEGLEAIRNLVLSRDLRSESPWEIPDLDSHRAFAARIQA
jgi:hypothetical protein